MEPRFTALAVASCLALSGSCGPSMIDPSPPLNEEDRSEADNDLLQGDEESTSCTGRISRARHHVDEALEEGIHGCAVDEDCTTVDPSTSCFGACLQPVARAGLDATAGAVADAEERWCEGFGTECAEHHVEAESCPGGELVCSQGECRRVVP